MNPPNTCCSRCGASFPDAKAAFPRRCARCGGVTWSNPVPVVVGLVPLRQAGREGLLVVRRGIEPRRGWLALPGGFLEDREPWEAGLRREVREETGLALPEEPLTSVSFVSTERHDRVLLFGRSAAVEIGDLPPLPDTEETLERGVVFGPDGLDEVFAFPLHAAAAARHFAERGVLGPHAFRAA